MNDSRQISGEYFDERISFAAWTRNVDFGTGDRSSEAPTLLPQYLKAFHCWSAAQIALHLLQTRRRPSMCDFISVARRDVRDMRLQRQMDNW